MEVVIDEYIHYLCPKCTVGYMVIDLMSNNHIYGMFGDLQPAYTSFCDVCNHRMTLPKMYPRLKEFENLYNQSK